MNDRMTPLPFGKLMRWALAERGAVFGVPCAYRADQAKALPLFDGHMETPCGPAAGPHTQLAQNIIAAYVAGARFFELKTVQTLDGEALQVAKPCILAADEGYNVEWSTELTVPQALDEYIKAWFAIKLLSRELALGAEDGFLFNMSVGYDLQGIRSPKIDAFIEGLKDAGHTETWARCRAWTQANLGLFSRVDAAYVDAISPRVSTSITLSTLHGCPPQEIERIARYLLTEKGLHTFIKCNPTLLGYAFARARMDAMGYDYLVFDDHHFRNDLQYEDAVPMLRRLMALAEACGRTFGVKLTNTFPVRIAAHELPGEEMYMSGRPLFALATALAAKLARTFEGALRISYCGGADAFSAPALFACGVYPITVATTLLKPGGYQRLTQLAEGLAAAPYPPYQGVDAAALARIAEAAAIDPRYAKPLKALPSRKRAAKVPLRDCFAAPCAGGCPIEQDVPAYIRLMGKGDALQALRVIVTDNPLPFITGTICSHRCQGKCRRNFYEETVHIRDVKLLAARQAMESLLRETAVPAKTGTRAAVIGGGPAGLAAAYFLARAGVLVTVFEKRAALGGVVRHAIPAFRIDGDAIDGDIALVRAMGVEVRLGAAVEDIASLRAEGYGHFVIAVGAEKRGRLALEGEAPLCAMDVLEALRADPEALRLGRRVAVIGGGNTAMDAARAVLRAPGVEQVRIVYRRDVRNMPADEAELLLAQAEGVCFDTLLSPVRHAEGLLTCEIMALGDPDGQGRRMPVATGAYTDIQADTVIAAVGERVDEALLARLDAGEGCYVIGDAKAGPATVVEAIADARAAADAILLREGRLPAQARRQPAPVEASAKKGRLMAYTEPANEAYRCLACDTVCESCVDVCPNRANVAVTAGGRPQIVHIDRLCNQCGNCEAFCPYDSAPYREKFTLFDTQADFAQSDAPGMVVLDRRAGQVLLRAAEGMGDVVEALLGPYGYML